MSGGLPQSALFWEASRPGRMKGFLWSKKSFLHRFACQGPLSVDLQRGAVRRPAFSRSGPVLTEFYRSGTVSLEDYAALAVRTSMKWRWRRASASLAWASATTQVTDRGVV